MGYKSPYNKVGQLKPEMKNQSKSSIAMKDSGIYMQDQSPLSMSPLNSHGAGGTHPDPKKGDKLPSYNTTTYNASASGSGGGSSSQNLSTSNLSNYQSTLIDKGSGFKPTPEQTAKANAEVKRLKALDTSNAAANAASSSNLSQSNSESTSTRTITLGDQTLNQIKKGGEIKAQNRRNKINAEREYAVNRAYSDSVNVANKFLNKLPTRLQNNPKALKAAQGKGNLAAIRTLTGSDAFSQQEIKKMTPRGQNFKG
jgi:hypothetical protein